MSTFVLVHGAWQSSGTWDFLSPLLKEHGHRVITPILRGLGTDQSHLTSDVTLLQHVDDVSTELASVGDKAVLVGHSYAGMVISGAVESHPTKIQRLIFLDAFIPEDGQCVMDLLPPQICALFRKVAQEHGYESAHDAKDGRGDSRVNIYRDKTTGKYWVWDGKSGSEKDPL